MARDKKGQLAGLNSQAIVAIIVGIVLLFAFAGTGGGSGSINTITKASELQDNTIVVDPDVDKQQDQEINSEFNETQGAYNVSVDETTGDLVFTNQNTSVETVVDDIGNFINLDAGETLEYATFNEEFDVNGFDRYFQGYLAKQPSGLYNLYYKINTQKYVIKDLEFLNSVEMGNLDGAVGGFANGIGGNPNGQSVTRTPKEAMYVQFIGDEAYDVDIVSAVGIDAETGAIQIVTAQEDTNGGAWLTGTKESHRVNFMDSLVGLERSYIYDESYPIGGTGINQIFSTNTLESYSFTDIALITDTRTVGFDSATIVKQELDDDISGFSDKSFKYINQEDLQELVQDTNAQLSELLVQQVGENIQTENLMEDILVGGVPRTIDSGSINPNGIVIDNGYVETDDLLNGSVLTVSHIKYDDLRTKGLQIDDLGRSNLQTNQPTGTSFGNLMDEFELQTHGTAYVVGFTLWDSFKSSLILVFNFDYSALFALLSGSAENSPILADDLSEVEDVAGDVGAFVQAYQDSGSAKTIGLTSEQPLTTLLTFNGENYWLLYTLETQSAGQQGCMVFDMQDINLGQRIGVNICGETLGGTAGVAQFKMLAE